MNDRWIRNPCSRFTIGLVLVTLGAVACGGSSKPAASPDGLLAKPSTGGQAVRPERPQNAKWAARPRMGAAAARAYEAGQVAFKSGDLNGAEAQFLTASEDEKAFQAMYALGTVLERKGKVAAALDAYRSSLEVVPDFEPPISAIAQLFLREERVAEAESFLNRQRSKVPNSAAVLTALAEVKSVQKDSAEAQRLAQDALKKDPDYRPAMVVLARDHYRNRRLDLALYTLTAVLDGYGPENPPRDKHNAEARLIRALIYKEQGNRKGAMAELRRAVESRPDLVEARLNLAAYMLEAGNASAAVPVLEGALPYDSTNVLVHLGLGDAYRLQGRPKEALKQLEWVSQSAPKLPQTQYNLGLVYLFSPKIDGLTEEQAIDKAIASFETYKKMQPRSRPGAGDDAEELLQRAKNKKAILAAMKDDGGDGFEEGEDEFE